MIVMGEGVIVADGKNKRNLGGGEVIGRVWVGEDVE
jgi:hypothetical protein